MKTNKGDNMETVTSILSQYTDYNHLCLRLKVLSEELGLGPIQSKAFFESFAIVFKHRKHNNTENPSYAKAIKNLKRYGLTE
jgi:hypothetical protein